MGPIQLPCQCIGGLGLCEGGAAAVWSVVCVGHCTFGVVASVCGSGCGECVLLPAHDADAGCAVQLAMDGSVCTEGIRFALWFQQGCTHVSAHAHMHGHAHTQCTHSYVTLNIHSCKALPQHMHTFKATDSIH